MTKQEAINLLKESIQKLDSTDFDKIVWTSTTISVLKKVFPESHQSKSEDIGEISYYSVTGDPTVSLQKGKKQAAQFLNEYINELDRFGPETGVNGSANEAVTVGKTFWDVIEKLFSKKPIIVFSTLLGIVIISLILIITGILKFNINDGKLSLSFKSITQNNNNTNTSSIDELSTFCLTNGFKLDKQYILKSVIQTYDIELLGAHKDTMLVRERIIYDLLALEDITKAQNIFKEEYSSEVAFKVERWFGTGREDLLQMGNESKYFVHFDCSKGESQTIMTGANFYYKLPLQDNRDGVFREYRLASNEDLWIYPNEDDVIGKLTMIVSSKDLKFQPISENALMTYSDGQGKVNKDNDAFYNFDQNSLSKNNSVSYTWTKILPDEQLALKIKWQ